MSFIFSRALVEASSLGKCSGIDASALSSGSPTPPLFLPSDKTTAFSRLSRFGMTFGRLTDDLGAALLTSWLEGFPAKTFQSQAKVPASTESEVACGPTWRGSLAKFDPAASSWRTAQPSLLGDSDEFSVTWPRSGMTAGGLCWELPMLELRTSATVSGLLPTPLASNTKAHHMRSNGRPARSYLPTPVASDTGQRKKPYAQGGTQLSLAVKTWATPICRDSRTIKGGGANDECTWQRAADYASRASGGLDGWRTEPALGRVAHGVAARVDRLKAIGNGQVPLCAATAYRLLSADFD